MSYSIEKIPMGVFCSLMKDYQRLSMKGKQILSKQTIVFALSSILLFSVPFFVNESLNSKIKNNNVLNGGANTCFTRVSQTFTALMISDFSSQYLNKDFVNTTGECFNQLNKTFDQSYGASFSEAKKSLNKLISDLHWFHEKTDRLAKMASDGAITLSTSSNILNKFTSLEADKINFLDAIDKKNASYAAYKNLSVGLAFAGFCMLMVFVGLNIKDQYQENEFLYGVNELSKELLTDTNKNAAKIDRLVEHMANKLEIPYFYELLSQYQADFIDANMPTHRGHAADMEAKVIEDRSMEKVSEKPAPKAEVTEFGKIINVLMDRLNNKAFTHGIIFDTDLGENFNVKGSSESIEQLIFTLINQGIESSLKHNAGRRVRIRSKALGGIAYFKMSVSNHLFNPDELEALNHGDSEKLANNMNLMLINEIANDLNVGVSFKNKVNDSEFTGSEIEIVFNRIMEDVDQAASKKVSVFKGKKSDIQRMFSEI
tara:strand:- start:135526 stop:136983 length:1458 start_codon:yes stop_codon:yes gene_type:complete